MSPAHAVLPLCVYELGIGISYHYVRGTLCFLTTTWPGTTTTARIKPYSTDVTNPTNEIVSTQLATIWPTRYHGPWGDVRGICVGV